MQSIPCPITAADLKHLYHDLKLTDQQIVDRLGGDATVKRVRAWRHRYGIETILRTARHEVPTIEGQLRSLLLGSMLGDGRLSRGTNTTRYLENHALYQQEYAEWKRLQWGTWVKHPLKPVVWKKENRDYPGVRFETVSHTDLNEWQALFYPGTKGSKVMPPELVPMVAGDTYALAIWYMDDGCADWWPLITVAEGSAKVTLKTLDTFGLYARWRNDTPTTGRVIIEGEDNAHRFIELVKPHIPECMSYKLDFGFQGPHYQARQSAPEEKLRELALEGVPIREIARRLGIGASTVDRYLKGFDIEHPRKIGRPLDTF